jgi:type III pantothenate kinase
MISGKTKDLGPLSIVVVDIGNTNVAVAQWVNGNVKDVQRVPTSERTAVHALDEVRKRCENKKRQAIVIASVVPSETQWLATHVEDTLDLRPFVVGNDTPLPLEVDVREPSKVGVDRVCAGAAAFARLGQACTIVDIGSAVTIDVIDDEGIFRGGAILPGLLVQVKALAGQTAGLPLVKPDFPASAIGKDTREAIQSGVCFGLLGAIRGIVEQIATEANKWPYLVATGGGAVVLKNHLDFVDAFVPDLCLMGVGLAYMKRLEESTRG